jgi:hypothetical protein
MPMDYRDVEPLREILHRALVRYLTVTSAGLVLEKGELPRPAVEARILGFGGARTLYRKRKPACRSLDGVAAVTDSAKLCAECPDRKKCTPQVRLDLIVEQRAFRLLLAFTSARNFLEYDARLRRDGVVLEDVLHAISVVDRGAWGELRFSIAKKT